MIKKLLFLALMVLINTITWASIIYTDINPDTTYASGGNFDFDNNGTTEIATTDGKYMNLTKCKIWTMGTTFPTKIVPKPISIYTIINSGAAYSTTSYVSMDNWGSGTSFPLNTDAYLAFCFTKSGNSYYGWMRVMYDGTHFIYKDYAYENTPNTLIIAGNTGNMAGTYDIAMDNINIDDVFIKGNIQIKGRIKNIGSNAIDTFNIVYTIDGANQSPIDTIIASQSIINSQTYDFVCNLPWNASSLGNHKIKITAMNPNGHTDINIANDTLSKSLLILNEKFTKTIVCEEGGGTWCKFCPRGLVGLNTMAHNHPDSLWIGIAVHTNGSCYSTYAGEPMVVAGYSNKISSFVQYVPKGAINRNSNEILNMTISSLEKALTKHSKDLPVGKIAITNQTWSGRNFTIESKSTFAMDYTAANFRVSLVVIEDDVTGTAQEWAQHDYYQGASTPMVDWDGFNYNTKGTLVIEGEHYVPADQMHYHDVARQLVGGWDGVANSIPAAITHGTQYSYTFTGSIPAEHNPNNTSFVVLLIDKTTGRIINANKVKSTSTIGIANNKAKHNINIFPNPSNGIFSISNAKGSQISVYSIMGQKLYDNIATQSIEVLNLSFLNAGNYIIRISNSDFTTTKQISILK